MQVYLFPANQINVMWVETYVCSVLDSKSAWSMFFFSWLFICLDLPSLMYVRVKLVVIGYFFLCKLRTKWEKWENRKERVKKKRGKVIVCSSNWNTLVISLIYRKFVGCLPYDRVSSTKPLYLLSPLVCLFNSI
jgi:hypothetical protein